jgi:pantothenate kinase
MSAVPSRAAKADEDSNPSEFEGEIREFIRRDVAHLRRAVPESASEQAVTSINSLLDRVSGSSVTEIDGLIADLSNVREFLKNEGERVQREIASYAQLSQVAMTSVKIIAESMSQWKSQVSDARLDRA